MPLATRATLGNMSPEYGSTVAIFPVDDKTLSYLRLTGRSTEQIALVRAHAKEQGLWHNPDHEPEFSQVVELDLGTVEPSIAGPKRPQDRISLSVAQRALRGLLARQPHTDAVQGGLDDAEAHSFPASIPIAISGRIERDEPPRSAPYEQPFTSPFDPTPITVNDVDVDTNNGAVVIAAITTSTTTSNPTVMIGAGLLVKEAVERALRSNDVMIRGTFANVRLRNQLVPGVDGGFTRYLPNGTQNIFDAAMAYAEHDVPLLVLAGSDYGSGSSRDWAATGTILLGVKAVPATSFERIHRSNLIGLRVAPLQFQPGETAEQLGLNGKETSSVLGPEGADPVPGEVTVRAEADGQVRELTATVRIDTPAEAAYFQHDGILPYVLRHVLQN